MAYPSTITAFSYPTPTSRLNNPSHSGVENAQSSAIGQLQTFIGLDGSSSTLGTLLYDIRSPGSNGGGHVQSANKGGTGQTSYSKGDILVASSSSVLSKVAVGSDGTALVADSSQSSGVNWSASLGAFGGGIDGVADFNGVNTFSFANLVGSTYTITRDIYLTTLTIENSIILVTDGYRVFANVAQGSGTISFGNGANGGNASSTGGITGGAGGASTGSGVGRTRAGENGVTSAYNGSGGTGDGNNNAANPATAACLGSVGSNGGVGGNSSGHTGGTAGGAGAITVPFTKFGTIKTLVALLLDQKSDLTLTLLNAQGSAAGGGGGSCSQGTAVSGGGGGGGASGGILLLCFNHWNGSFIIKAIGGNGGTGGSGAIDVNAGGGGGGAGGNGGIAVVLYGSKTWTGSYTLTAGTGGSGGSGTGGGGTAGVSGSSGTTGTSYEIPLSNLF